MTALREEIYEELTNLAEFGEQESATNNILKIIEKRIDSMIQDTYVITTQDTSTTISTVAERRALRKVKEMLK